jgi:hypothetical protein
MNAKEIHKEPTLIRLSHELVMLSLRASVEIATAAPFSRRIGIDDRRRTHGTSKGAVQQLVLKLAGCR